MSLLCNTNTGHASLSFCCPAWLGQPQECYLCVLEQGTGTLSSVPTLVLPHSVVPRPAPPTPPALGWASVRPVPPPHGLQFLDCFVALDLGLV